MRTRALAWALLACSAAAPALAQATGQDGAAAAPSFRLRGSIKGSALLFRTPDAPEVFPARTGAESLWRARFEPEVRAGRTRLSLAYEQRLRVASGAAGFTTVGILPSQAVPPFRLRALDWSLSQSSGSSWRHEIDRANAQVSFARGELTIGRQAVGWGRGVLFGAVDLFAPFSPLEADREWRRGVDAVHGELELSDRSSVDVVGAFGQSWDRSIVAARVRGFAGPIDVEAMGGRRARDLFGGLTSSAAIGDAALHGEVAAFRLPDGQPGGDGRVVWKAVAGGSFRVPVGKGVLTYVEYHYSGFGAARPDDIPRLLADPAFAERYLRGDTQILSRHALAVLGSYEASPELSFTGQWLHNPADRSGVIAPTLTITLSDQLSVIAAVYAPYGARPRGTTLQSEYGTAPLSGFLQLRTYF